MTSRYEGFDTETRVWRGRMIRGLQLRPPRTWAFAYADVTVTDDDRWDLLADKYLGDPYRWWEMADANPEIFWWGDLEPGTRIRMPYV